MIAVITGDIVASQSVQPSLWVDLLSDELQEYGSTPGEWEIYRGDSFQLRIEPENALSAVIKLKAEMKTIKELDIRVAIGIGAEEYISSRISQSNGEAYIRSGSCFDALKKKRLAICSPWANFDRQWNMHFQLASLVMDEWTAIQAEEVKRAFTHTDATQKELARMSAKTPSTVNAHLHRAGYRQISEMLDYYQVSIKEQLNQRS